MKSRHTHSTRTIFIILIVLMTITFLGGTINTFASAKVSSPSIPLVEMQDQTPTPLPGIISPTPSPDIKSADTAGIIALGTLVMLILLFGVIWGSRTMLPRSPKNNKQ